VNGIHHTQGLTVYDQDEAAVSRNLIKQARQVIVVADHTKLGSVATSLVCSIDEVDILVTDTVVSPDAVAPFIKKRIKVLQV
jgi:DeoR family transcriptional regulator of aga operon